MRTRAVLTHTAQAVAEGALVALLVVGLAAGTTFAAKGGGGTNKPGGGGGGTSGSLSGPVMVLDQAGNGLPNYMDNITFAVSTTAATPYVGLRCWQAGSWVFDGYVGYFPSYMFDPWFTLGSDYWDPAVAASCTARLFYYDSRGREHDLATLDFGVDP